MKTTEKMVKTDILKYLVNGHDLIYATAQSKALRLHRFDAATDHAAKDLSWWCSLHQHAVEKLAFISTEWFRPREISDRPEVIRDLLSVGILECRSVPGKNKFNTICEYRKSANYLEG